VLNTILFFIRPYKVRFIFLLLVTVAASALESLNLAILLPLFNGLLAPSADIFQGMPSLFANMNKLLPFQDPILSVFALFVAIMLIKTSTDMLREWLKATTSGSVFYDLKKRLLQKYSALSYQAIISQKQ
jgi:ABC-type multidrug transport system fused ATPase/permease subunit